MLKATCHCGAIRIEIPSRPSEVTNCNCSICRRLGALWAYYDVGTVRIHGHPESTNEYIHGDRTLRTVRCRICGCTTHWEPLNTREYTRMGVNVRNFEPEVIGDVRIRLLDGADSWNAFYWEDPQAPKSAGP